MNKELFSEIIKALYPKHPQTGFGEEYRCDRVTVWRWETGKFKLPEDAAKKAADLLDERLAKLKELRGKIK